MKDVPAQTDLVLVCLLPQPRDLEIARVLGWYRIPLRHAPKVLYTDFLAFYQPASFGKEHQWMIEFVARVRGVELTRRKDLLNEEPFHPKAEDEYYKISIGELVQLDRPILADKWKRITFFYTTGEQLLHANFISDLVIDQSQRELFRNTVMEFHSKYTNTFPPADDMTALQQEFLTYFLELSAKIKKENEIKEADFD
ncbi:MAG TPA: hypothetical protein PLL88_05515 [Anaerolineaceae bacterium]|nr:hypothetical protein [Anaerolineaceae bacterium]